MENQFKELKEKFGTQVGMILADVSDNEIAFEIRSNDVSRDQLNIIRDFLTENFEDYFMMGIECIDNYQYLTYVVKENE